MPEPASDPIPFQVLNEIGIIQQLAVTLFERVMPDGLRMPHFIVLNHLVRLGGTPGPQQLARAFQISKGAITNTLQRLEARDLITVSPDPRDGRAKLVAITPAGRAMREAAIAALGPHVAQAQATLGSDIFTRVLPDLREIRRYLDQERETRT